MSLRVLFFASLADIVGQREAELDALQYRDVGSVLACFEARFPHLKEYRASLMFAVNAEFAHPDTPVKEGDEIAFLPPVSGG